MHESTKAGKVTGEPSGPAASPAQKEYMDSLRREAERCYEVAAKARALGRDPTTEVEIPMAEDLASRVERLVGPDGVAPLIRDMSARVGNREEVSLRVAEEIARRPDFESREQALDQAIRTGLAILTEGVLVAPLEGIAEVKVRREGASDYVDLYFAGPIRSAGGTGQALSVLIADVVRRALRIGPYRASRYEVERWKEEIPRYKQIQHLQYTPTPDEIDIMAGGCPICINGEGTEDEEVSGHRDLERVGTNRIRGGACLVMAEGLCLKASKIQKHVKNLGISGWEFVDEYLAGQKRKTAGDAGAGDGKGTGNGGTEAGGAPAPTDPAEMEDALLDPEEAAPDGFTYDEDASAAENFGPAANEKYIREIIAGRPVFSHPSRPGGFRLRYGRARTAGLASLAIHPAAMFLVNDFLAVGTQMKIERPGKATVATPCDTLEPPIVLLGDGTFREMADAQEVQALRGDIERIHDLGEILVPFGEFVENNHDLVPGAFSPEWWEKEVLDRADHLKSGENAGVSAPGPGDIASAADPGELLEACAAWGFPLHPSLNLFWHDISPVTYNHLREALLSMGRYMAEASADDAGVAGNGYDGARGSGVGGFTYTLTLQADDYIAGALMELGVLHGRGPGGAIVVRECAVPLLAGLGLEPDGAPPVRRETGVADPSVWRPPGECGLRKAGPFPAGMPVAPGGNGVERQAGKGPEAGVMDSFPGTLGLIRTRTGLVVYPRGPVRIGTRMGRPEKAKERRMNPHVHVLFPIGKKGGPQRLIKKAATHKDITVDVGLRSCPGCGRTGFSYSCPACGGHTLAPPEPRVSEQRISVGDLLDRARASLDLPAGAVPEMKGVQGLISLAKTPEPLEKGILRAKHGISIFKDGTIRFDMTDVPLTHFRPREIGTPVERLRQLGYTHDVNGRPLESPDQLLELRAQDVVASAGFGRYMTRTAKFVDELLVRFYGGEPYYRVEEPADLVGHMVIGLAPHTSGGVLGRLIGYTRAAVGFAHPFFHAAKRRNCDGDEDCLMLLLDGLLNFSRSYLPSSRGGQMDAPLVLSTRLDPNEIDKEAHNIDVGSSYPLEFYRAAQVRASPKAVEKLMDTIGSRIGTPMQYEGMGFTHDTSDISLGPAASSYKTLETMVDKMNAQLALARLLRPVDESDVANKVITSHFLPDMQGNLRSFTQQGARCTKCNAKYRRVPLRGDGKCIKGAAEGKACGGNLVLTVHEGGVTKYLEISKRITEEYDIPGYTRQRIRLLEESIRSTFENDKVRHTTLSDFL